MKRNLPAPGAIMQGGRKLVEYLGVRPDGIHVVRKRAKGSRDPAAVEELRREYATLEPLKTSQNVATVLEADFEAAEPGFFEKFYEGGPLTPLCGRLDDARLQAAAAQIVAGLSQIHERGSLHGDLKPDNILISDQGVMKLDDLLGPGVYGGTPGYWDPALQNAHQPINATNNIYSLKTTLYHLLTGRAPEPRTIPDPTGFESTPAQGRVADVIRRACNPDPRRRPTLSQIRSLLAGGVVLVPAIPWELLALGVGLLVLAAFLRRSG